MTICPERIRVTVHLSDGRDGRAVWAHTFESERTARDLFDLQDDLTRQAVSAIAGSHGALARAELPHSQLLLLLDPYAVLHYAISHNAVPQSR